MPNGPDTLPSVPPDEDAAKPSDNVFIVGIGASAGGLEAIRELVNNLPKEFEATYIIAQHLSPQHKSILTTLINRETHLNVFEIEDGTAPAPNTIYVTPPNTDAVYRNGVLQLQDPNPQHAAPKPSVDRLFISLAENAGERSVGIVLSGTGSDGAYGIQAIRGAGGITIAQDDQTAKYDGMPMAAVETGCVDLVLSPMDIGIHLAKIFASPRNFEELRAEIRPEHPLTDILQIVLARTRVDFREYKPTTIQRRIERRMVALGMHDQQQYAVYCRANPLEVDALLKDLLISVTRFFRDPDEFKNLRPWIEPLIESRGSRPLRVWVAGCATGEEAYSIAILVAEAMGGLSHMQRDAVQIFATDIDANALQIARRGRYTQAAIDDIPAEYVEKYFNFRESGVEVKSSLKDIILFSEHNTCQDPPFLNVDLVCCRNLLIYLGQSLQRKVLSRFHYSLVPRGILFLGTAEGIGGSEELFAPATDRWHIYRRRANVDSKVQRRSDWVMQSPNPRSGVGTSDAIGASTREKGTSDQSDRAMFDALARSLGPDALLADAQMKIMRVFGDLSPYVTLSEESRLQFNLGMLRQPLALEARTLVSGALKSGRRRRGASHRLNPNAPDTIHLEAFPVDGRSVEEPCVVLVFLRDETQEVFVPSGDQTDISGAEAEIERLQLELSNTREALQQTIEELETSNEELQSVNEELQSTNEELQATNEELETSNEELQSTNEELVTVNEEQVITAAELAAMADELESILENIAVPVLVVDSALQVTRASQVALDTFHIPRPSDRPHLSQCGVPAGFPSLPEICNDSLRLGKILNIEITTGVTTYTLRCSPFSNMSGQIAGATMVFVETPETTRLQHELARIMDLEPLALMHRDRNGVIKRLSRSTGQLFGTKHQSAIGHNIREYLTDRSADALIKGDQKFLDGPAKKEDETVEYEVRHASAHRWLSISRHRFREAGTSEDTVYAVGTDITESRREAVRADHLANRIRLIEELGEVGYWIFDEASKTAFVSEQLSKLAPPADADDLSSIESLTRLYEPDQQDAVRDAIERCMSSGKPETIDAPLVKADGSTVAALSSIAVQDAAESGQRTVVCVIKNPSAKPLGRP